MSSNKRSLNQVIHRSVKNDKKYSIVDNLPLPPETMVNYKKATQPKYKEF